MNRLIVSLFVFALFCAMSRCDEKDLLTKDQEEREMRKKANDERRNIRLTDSINRKKTRLQNVQDSLAEKQAELTRVKAVDPEALTRIEMENIQDKLEKVDASIPNIEADLVEMRKKPTSVQFVVISTIERTPSNISVQQNQSPGTQKQWTQPCVEAVVERSIEHLEKDLKFKKNHKQELEQRLEEVKKRADIQKNRKTTFLEGEITRLQSVIEVLNEQLKDVPS